MKRWIFPLPLCGLLAASFVTPHQANAAIVVTPKIKIAPTLPTPPVAVATTYTVVPGDSLWKLQTTLSRSMAQISGYNNLSDPNDLGVGEVLKVPPADYIGPPLVIPVPVVQAPVAQPVYQTPVYQSQPQASSNGQYHGLGQVAGESSSDPQTQLNDANSYVIERYGSWAAAWAHEEADGWY
jgi:LysM repeat protein